MALVLLGCSGGGGEPSPRVTEGSPTPSPIATATVERTPTLSPEEAVIEAYLRYWDVYGDGLYDLDTSRLSEVMTGSRLERALDEVQNLQGEGRAVKIVVENRPIVVQLEGDRAVVFDKYENLSHFIDPVTKEPLSEPGAGEVIRDRVTLTRIGETWKVLDSVREVE
ncbi:MAG: hypothetical protein Q7R32_13990 [Dehalococcoidia bacterium]|nr:hypothetical protein [Dehalococcoidia bacterium]